MKKQSAFLLVSLFTFAFPFALCAAVLDEATFDIQEGWNAVCLPVTPEVGADEVFADWPTDKVGFYDQAAFLRTKQFETSADDTTLGAVENGMKIWIRGNPGASSFHRLVANGIYVFNATNEVKSVAVRGVPAALRTSWHVCVSTNQPLNLVGVSTDGNDAVLAATGYFQGLDTGWTYAKGVLRDVWGFEPDPSLDFFYGEPTKPNLGVVAMDAAKASDWSGALNVSPMDGVDFGTNGVQRIVSIRNDAGTNRMVGLKLRASVNKLPVPKLLFTCSVLGGVYTNLVVGEGWATELAPGETLKMQLSLDRSQGGAEGEEQGAILDVIDVSPANPTHFKTSVPIGATVGGGATSADWPAGLWTVNLSLDKVADKKAGATMAARVLVHVGTNGVMNLMQRARVGSRRISSVVLPTDGNTVPDDTNRVSVTDGVVAEGAGTFGGNAAFVWTVADKSRANPFRHAKHPDHDGLDWDFKDTLPSGDNFTNYVAVVKPELFSISNRLEFAWDAHTGSAWNPAEALTGDCTWYLYGLRHEHGGVIKTGGTFTMKRVSKEGLEAVKEEF